MDWPATVESIILVIKQGSCIIVVSISFVCISATLWHRIQGGGYNQEDGVGISARNTEFGRSC